MQHVAEALVALGGAFLVCGLIARAGVPIGLPTIPLFMLAGVLLGPYTPGFVLVGDPTDLELVARLGLVFLSRPAAWATPRRGSSSASS